MPHLNVVREQTASNRQLWFRMSHGLTKTCQKLVAFGVCLQRHSEIHPHHSATGHRQAQILSTPSPEISPAAGRRPTFSAPRDQHGLNASRGLGVLNAPGLTRCLKRFRLSLVSIAGIWRLGSSLRRVFSMLIVVAVSASAFAQESVEGPVSAPQTNFAKALDSIQAADAKQHVTTLASDTFEGRDAGSRGGRAASIYLAQKFRKYNLQGSGSATTYFQDFGNECRNILGLLPGADPKLKDEFILIGAHYDHVGYGNQSTSYGPVGFIHNGADDNASGVSAVLEIAEAWQLSGERPARSLIFALWDSEEHGLLGSRHWISHPTCSMAALRCVLNLDMVGRVSETPLEVTGVRTMAGMRTLLSRHNRETNLKLNFLWHVKDDSDHWPFFERRVPFIMPFSGFHSDYHRPSDDVDKINYQGIQRVARWIFGVSHELANSPVLPRFRPEALQEMGETQKQREVALPASEPRFPARLAPMDGGPGRALADVFPQSAAAFVGLRAGDRIVRFGDEVIEPQTNLAGLILRSPSPVRVHYLRAGQPTPNRVLMTLTGQPIRVGVNWRDDAAEPGTVAINLVEVNSPAHLAGLKVHDRVWQVNGQEFRSGTQFREMLSAASGPVTLLIERLGQLKTITLELPEDEKPLETGK